MKPPEDLGTPRSLEIEVEPPPSIRVTINGYTDEEGAAAYIGYLMRTRVTVRRLQDWRRRKVGPAYRKMPHGREIWYLKTDLDSWAEACVIDPLGE